MRACVHTLLARAPGTGVTMHGSQREDAATAHQKQITTLYAKICLDPLGLRRVLGGDTVLRVLGGDTVLEAYLPVLVLGVGFSEQ